MGRIWNKMHTENLFIFDHYYNKHEKRIMVPKDKVCFVSHFDMCEACETMMVKFVEQMGECPITYFNQNREYQYKILVGSFVEYKNSRKRDDPSKLLKIKRIKLGKFDISAFVKQPIKK